MMGTQQEFCLRWNDHQVNLLSLFDSLLQNESFVDVTLACDGLSLKAHKVVLSACSPYFQKLLLDNPCPHPIVILKDVNYVDLKALVDFMYKGEVHVLRDQLHELVKTAELLKIRGFSESSHTASVLDACVNQKHCNNRTKEVHSEGVEHASPTSSCSRPRKNKRVKRQQTSGSASANQDNVVERNGSPELLESIMDVPQSLGNCDGYSQPERCNVSSEMLSPKVETSDHESDPGVPEQNIHEVHGPETESGYWFGNSQSPQCNISTEMLISEVKAEQDIHEELDPDKMSPKHSLRLGSDADTKRRRKAVTLKTKHEILRRIEAGEKIVEICKSSGLAKSTIQTIRKNKEKIKSHLQSATPLSASKLTRQRSSKMERMENLLSIWIEDNNQRRMPISQMLIQEKAKSIFENLKSDETDETAGVATFQASRGWFEKFKNRQNLHNIRMKGESSSADLDAAKEYPNILKGIVESGGYLPGQAFNVDGTGFYD